MTLALYLTLQDINWLKNQAIRSCFGCPKMPPKITKNQPMKTINLVEFVNFRGLNYFICV